MPQRVDTIEDIKLWIAEFHGRNEVWCETQRERSASMEQNLARLSVRITSVERRMIWVAGFAAALGGAVGRFFLDGLV